MRDETDRQNSKLQRKVQASADKSSIRPQYAQLSLPLPGSAIADAPGQLSLLETDPARSTAAYPVANLDMEPSSITSFIQGHVWKFAKTMPHNPHWYVVKEKCRSAEEFERYVMHIRRFGYKEKFQGWYYTVFDWQTPDQDEPFKYWSMGFPLEQTIIINRKALSYDKK